MKLWKITNLGLLIIILLIVWIFIIGISSNQPGSFFNKDHNAIWIGHQWVGEEKSDREIQELVNNLKDHGIDTVFVHSGPLKADGSIDPGTYRYAVEFIETARSFDSNIQYQAWIGQIRNKIDLSDSEVRHNIANQCMLLGQLIDFDGIHFDIEPVWDGDTDFIITLKECRELLPDEKVISVALAELIPYSVIWFTENIHDFDNYNTEKNYENVALYADQVIVMTYDTSIKSEWIYKWLVKEETIRITSFLDEAEVFIGIPAYEGDVGVFDPEVENIKNGLLGIIMGLNNLRSNEDNFAGVAIYPYWEMDDDEWETYENLWLK